ncbi:MAG: thioredoxin family protein [Bdellovibrio sp.]|nr:MAG: thioredoxin family protein [Bdellovibrio sp.]
MALTHTPQAEIGAPLPDFQLPSTEGELISTQNLPPFKALLVMFICNHCPYVKAIEDRLIQLGNSFKNQPVQFLAICSNDPTDYPEDAPEELKKRARDKNYPFPYLIDESQDVAKAFGAVCTPDFFLYNEKKQLVYRGRLDDSWNDPQKVSQQDLKEAIEALLNGETPSTEQHPSMGCSIKWKKSS